MKANIYYFTGTGNSLVVAQDIAGEIEGELISIPYIMGKGPIKTNASVIVIVYPVYMWGIPLIVERFIRNFKDISHKNVYAIATNGGTPGVTINVLEKIIKECNGKLSAGFTVVMPGNYIPKYGTFSEKKQKILFDKWHEKVRFIAEYIKQNKVGIRENSNRFMNLIFSNIIYKFFAKQIPTMDKNFWYNEKCNKCGICKNICPVGNIDMNSGNPKWNSRCEQCLACLQWCPQEAIQYGNKTSIHKRYHHPEIELSNILNQAKK